MKCLCPKCGVALDVKPRTSEQELPAIDPLAWQTECEMAVVHLANLLYSARERPTVLALVELVRQLPRSAAVTDLASDSFLHRCIFKAYSRRTTWNKEDRDEFKRFLRSVSQMSAGRRALFEASVVGALAGYGRAV